MLSLFSAVLFVAIWMTAFEVFTGKCESHAHGRRPLRFTSVDGDTRNERDDRQPLDPSAFEPDDETVIDGPLELDKPLPVEQVAVPAGGKARLPCDTQSWSDPGRSGAATTGFYMVMWFKEQAAAADPDDDSDDNGRQAVIVPGEPVFTYDTRKQQTAATRSPRWWTSPAAFGDRAYFHATAGAADGRHDSHDRDRRQPVGYLTVDRAAATDAGVYRCRVDFLTAPTRNSLVNLTVIVAPDRPKIYVENGNAMGGDRQDHQRGSRNLIVIDEGTPTVTLVCHVVGGWPRPRLTWYHENEVLDSTYELLAGGGGGYHKQRYRDRVPGTATGGRVTVNRLSLTNLTRWHPVMYHRLLTTAAGTTRLTCQASNSVATAGDGHVPPPATTEHAFVRLNLKPTEAQVVSVREGGEGTGDRQAAAAARSDEGRGPMAADGAALVAEDAAGHKKYTVRAGRLYRAECRSKGSRPLAAIEWYLLKRNRRYDVGRSAANGTADGPVPSSVQPGESRGGASMVVESTVASVVETQQTPTVSADDDEITVTTSVLSFVLRGPKSAVADENGDDDDNGDDIFVLVCRTFNPVIKTFDRHHVETRISLDVQYPPVVQLRFGNRMLDTGQIGPGDDVYFECAARANPSTTIRYSWYHNGVQLTQDAEKRRTDDGERKSEKKTNKLASRVIQYSQLGSLVLQSVKVAAAGKYACRATNGIDNDSNDNKTISNIVRLFVKHVPVCRHREDATIAVRKSESGAGPAIRCRAGRGHPPSVEYRWTFYPDQQPTEYRDGEPDGTMTLAARTRDVRNSLRAETAVVQGGLGGGGGGGTTSYTFTTSTPVLKSYVTAVKAAAAAVSNAATVHPNFLRGRLECRAVNAMGAQRRPCVYHITDKTAALDRREDDDGGGGRDLREVVDCRPMAALTQDRATGGTDRTRGCGAGTDDTGPNRTTRFCVACAVNAPASRSRRRRPNYVLQLFKVSVRGRTPPTHVSVAFNVTGVTAVEIGDGNRAATTADADDDDEAGDDYYADPDEDGDENDVGGEHDHGRIQRTIVFAIDDGVTPGVYRGRIYDGDGGTVTAIVRDTIVVAATTDDDDDDDGYYAGQDETDESTIFGSAWSSVTVTLSDMLSMMVPSASHRGRQPSEQQWGVASVALTAVLVTVVMALSCGVCVVVAILYRRLQNSQSRGHVYSLGCAGGVGRDVGDDDDDNDGGGGGGDDDDGNDGDGIGQRGNGKTIVAGGRPKAETVLQAHNGHCAVTAVGDVPEQRTNGRPDGTVNDASNNNYVEAAVPLLERHRQEQQQRCRPTDVKTASRSSDDINTGTATAVLTARSVVIGNRGHNSGPDVVMSTSSSAANTGGKSSWPRKQQQQQKRLVTTNKGGNRQQQQQKQHQQRPLHVVDHRKPATAVTARPMIVSTGKRVAIDRPSGYAASYTTTVTDEPPPPVLLAPSARTGALSAFHRESSI